MNPKVSQFIELVSAKNPGQKEFIQAVQEVAERIIPFIDENPQYKASKILERMVEPERVVMFRVPWMDDKGEVHINRGYRVEFNSAIGPYKGGLRFHPNVTLSSLKFLGFEQTFKNSLTGLPMGGGKGGSDFNPNGKSDNEVMRFCQSFMTELYRHVGPDTDVPAGDVGVGGREIGYLFGQYKRIVNRFDGGVLTGKGIDYGGSLIRPEATGFGAVYFVQHMLASNKDSLKGKTIGLSGFGNVAWGAAIKLVELGAKVITLSGPDGYIYDADGISGDKIEYMLEMRASGHDAVKDYADKFGVEFKAGERPWDHVTMDIAMPCAFQNELNEQNAANLVKNGCKYVAEVSNMGCTLEAHKIFSDNNIAFAPGKAANAGGVAVSGLEMSQNSIRLKWKAAEVDEKLKDIMENIHEACEKYGKNADGSIDYVTGANIGGFIKVADAMLAQGLV